MSVLPPRPLFISPRKPKPPKRKWRIFYVMGTALKRTCMVLGAMMLFSAVTSAFLIGALVKHGAPSLPDKIVLYLPLEQGFTEHENESGFSFTAEAPLTIRQFTQALDAARDDPRVQGFLTIARGGGLNLAHLQEARAAIKRFRESGKFAWIYAPSYTDAGQGLGMYYLASAFDTIWMQPMGTLSITGIKAEMPFFRDVLDKIGVEPQVFSRKEYKSVFENMTDRQMSPASREAMTALVDDLAAQMMTQIAVDRGMPEELFKEHINQGLFLDTEALQAGLIDRLEYADMLEKAVRGVATGNREDDSALFVKVGYYAESESSQAPSVGGDENKKHVALVYLTGTIVASREGVSRADGVAPAGEIVEDIRNAAKDENVEAIVLRVDSPGGSPAAAETIRRAVVKAKTDTDKPVIVSMGSAAASGGYWVSAPADQIFALPSTLTGSIGVAGGKFVFKDMWEKLSVRWDGVEVGGNAGFWSMNEPFSETGIQRMNTMMDSVYDAFIDRVAEGRSMSEQAVDKVARGRVWTGMRAAENGLVDQLGGLDDALDYAAAQIGAEDRHDVNILLYPQPLTPVEQLVELLDMQVRMGQTLNVYAGLLEPFKPFLETAIWTRQEDVMPATIRVW